MYKSLIQCVLKFNREQEKFPKHETIHAYYMLNCECMNKLIPVQMYTCIIYIYIILEKICILYVYKEYFSFNNLLQDKT